MAPTMTDHPDLIALRAAVLAAPADDVPRLALADWLEENAGEEDCPDCPGTGEAENGCPRCGGFGRVPNHSDARAEFIRVQCEIARLEAFVAGWAAVPGRAEDGGKAGAALADAQALRKREAELLTHNAARWLPDLPGYNRVISGWTKHVTRDDGENVMVGPELVIRAEFRRGFVAHVTCPLSAWLGGPCERCRVPHVGVSRGLVIRSHSGGSEFAVADCPDCRGTGSVGGVAAAVCGSQPVERVTISDKEPEEHQPPGETPPNYSWYSQGFPDDRATLPLVLFDRLTDWMPCLTDGTMRRAYPTRRAALDALSAAALAVGREWAGLTRP